MLSHLFCNYLYKVCGLLYDLIPELYNENNNALDIFNIFE